MNQLLITAGILVSYLADHSLADGGHWRWMFALAAIPAMILGIGMIFLPESPPLASRYRPARRARQVERVRSPEEAESEMQLMKSPVKVQEAGWTELMRQEYRPGPCSGHRFGDISASHRNQHRHLLRAHYLSASRLQFGHPVHLSDCRSRSGERAVNDHFLTTAGPARP